MKQINSLSYLLVAVLCVGFVSCSSDDDPDDSVDDLVGKWQLVHSKGWQTFDGGVKYEWDEDAVDGKGMFYTFEADGTGIYAEVRDIPRVPITWKLNGDKLTIWEIWGDDDPDDSDTYTVTSFNVDKVVLVYQREDYYEERTFVRFD